jgi:uncharacterized protein
MIYLLAHKTIVAIYLAAPIAAMVIDFRSAWRRKRSAPTSGLIASLSAAVLMGTGLALLYGFFVGGRVPIGQVLLAIYFALGLLLILKALDYVLRTSLSRLWRSILKKPNTFWRSSADLISFSLRVCILILIGLPYIMAAVMTYRPKIAPSDNPQKQLGYSFEPVSFRTSDGLTISGWWMPAFEQSRRRLRSADFGSSTVIACHGLGSSKSNQLILARPFVPAGYNVLIFDFRAHGESDGQLSSFGDLERRDVLAAVCWLRDHRPQQCKHIYGVGASMGAAALIAAAADPSPEGQAIDAVAVLDTYDSLAAEFHAVTRQRFPQPLRWTIDQLAMPIASAQVGTDLNDFAPATLVQRLWPRPILVVHGTGDKMIDFGRGQQLFNAACQPKQRLWIDGADHNSIIDDDAVMNKVRQFFESAKAEPII